MPQCESLHYALAIEPGHQYVSGQMLKHPGNSIHVFDNKITTGRKKTNKQKIIRLIALTTFCSFFLFLI